MIMMPSSSKDAALALAYHAAVVEADRFKVPMLVQAAADAISKRLESIAERSGHEVERRAMLDTLESLGFLNIESTKAPPVAQSRQYKVNPFRLARRSQRAWLLNDRSFGKVRLCSRWD